MTEEERWKQEPRQRGEERRRFHPVFAVGLAEFVIRDQATFTFPFAQRVQIHGPVIFALHAHEPFVSHASLNRESVRKLGRLMRGTFASHFERCLTREVLRFAQDDRRQIAKSCERSRALANVRM